MSTCFYSRKNGLGFAILHEESMKGSIRRQPFHSRGPRPSFVLAFAFQAKNNMPMIIFGDFFSFC